MYDQRLCVTPKWSYDLLNLVVVERPIWEKKKKKKSWKDKYTAFAEQSRSVIVIT